MPQRGVTLLSRVAERIVVVVPAHPTKRGIVRQVLQLRVGQPGAEDVDPLRPASLLVEAMRPLAGYTFVLPEDPGRTRTLASLHGNTLSDFEVKVRLGFELPCCTGAQPLFIWRIGTISLLDTPGDPSSGYASVQAIRDRVKPLLP